MSVDERPPELAATIELRDGTRIETTAQLIGIDSHDVATYAVHVDVDGDKIEGLYAPLLPGHSALVISAPVRRSWWQLHRRRLMGPLLLVWAGIGVVLIFALPIGPGLWWPWRWASALALGGSVGYSASRGYLLTTRGDRRAR